MKIIGYFASLVLLTLASLSAAEAQTAPSTCKFTENSWNFGKIQEVNGAVSHTFEFTNTGSTPFVLENVITSCGCTTPKYSREPILPGKKGKIEVVFDPAGRPGPFRKEITITSNNRTNINKLTITGEVIERPKSPEEDFPVLLENGLRVERQSAGMGYLPRGGTKSITIGYYNPTSTTLNLSVEYGQPNNYFYATFSSTQLKPKERAIMTLTYDLSKASLWGRLTDSFNVLANGRKATLPFSVTGVAVEDFSLLSSQQRAEAPRATFSSQYYHFGKVAAGTTLERKFTIVNEGKQPLKIEYISVPSRMTISLKQGTVLDSAKELSFTVKLDTQGLPVGNFLESAVIILNDPERPMREMRLAGTIEK